MRIRASLTAIVVLFAVAAGDTVRRSGVVEDEDISRANPVPKWTLEELTEHEQAALELAEGTRQLPGRGGSGSFNYLQIVDTTGNLYPWIDASNGTELTELHDDDAHAEIPWGFPFMFYDDGYAPANQLSISSNGWIRTDAFTNGWVYPSIIPDSSDVYG